MPWRIWWSWRHSPRSAGLPSGRRRWGRSSSRHSSLPLPLCSSSRHYLSPATTRRNSRGESAKMASHYLSRWWNAAAMMQEREVQAEPTHSPRPWWVRVADSSSPQSSVHCYEEEDECGEGSWVAYLQEGRKGGRRVVTSNYCTTCSKVGKCRRVPTTI